MTGYFITGTDTGVGKTYVTAALARHATGLGRRVFAFKPIETGCDAELGPDQQIICAAAGGWQGGELRGLYHLRRPLAPLVAAEAEGVAIDLDRICEVTRRGAALADLTLVEGAGGWRVPLTSHADIGALARRLDLPVIIVARATLGTISHSLLTIEAVLRDGCEVAALVLSRRPDDDRLLAQSNAEQIQRRWAGRVMDQLALERLV